MTEQSFTTNDAPDPIEALCKCPCCACSMALTGFVNMVITTHPQQWKYPQAGNVLTGERHGAIAILCDKCIKAKVEIKNLVELRNGEVILHPVGEKEPTAPPMGSPAWIIEDGNWVYLPELDLTREAETYGICECGAELTEEEWEMFNGRCSPCAEIRNPTSEIQ